MITKKINFLLLIVLLSLEFTANAIQSFNRSYFYRASSLWAEPRFEQPYLSTFTFTLSGGETNCASNACGKTVPIVKLARPCQAIDFSNKPRWQYNGSFDLLELNFNIYQSIGQYAFFHLHIPAMHTRFSPGTIIEYPLTMPLIKCQKQTKALCCPKSKWGLSDITLFWGITKNSYDLAYLDFYDYSFEAGILFPTSQPCCFLEKYDIPLGYNGHGGATVMFNGAIGMYNWLTLACHADVTLLASHVQKGHYNKILNYDTNGGPITRIGALVKADHICYGLSLALGLSRERKHAINNYAKQYIASGEHVSSHKNRNKIRPFCEQIDGWYRSIFHLIIEIDGYQKNNLVPEFAFSYHKQINGRNVLNTSTLAGTLSLNFLWEF